jgi:hypothetical protein
MKMNAKLSALALALLAGSAMANSTFVTGPGPLNAGASVDLRVTIPKVLFVQVGAGSLLANNATVSLLDFTVNPLNVGDSTPVASVGGDLGAGAGITARVVGNGGNISFTATTTGALNDGAGNNLSYSNFTVGVAAHPTFPSVTNLVHPALVDGATGATSTLTAVNQVVNQSARWDFTYNNSSILAAGTYGGVNLNNSRVTYTASLP